MRSYPYNGYLWPLMRENVEIDEPPPERLASVPIRESQSQYFRQNEYSKINGKHFLWGKETSILNNIDVIKKKCLWNLWSFPF